MNPIIQQIKPLFFDHDALRVEPRTLYRVDYKDHRQYYTILPDGSAILYNGTTTILSHTMKTPPGVIDWIVNQGGRDQAASVLQEHADYGTFLHALCTEFCLKGSIDLDAMKDSQELFCQQEEIVTRDPAWIENAKNDLLCFAQFVFERNVKPLAIEILLASDTYGHAGALDLICRMDWNGQHVMAIVDWKKTRKGFHDSHALQLAAYRKLMQENFPDITEPVYLFNWGPKEFRGTTPTYNLKDQSDWDNLNWHRFETYNHLYCLANQSGDDDAVGTYRTYAGPITFGKPPKDNIFDRSIFEQPDLKIDAATHKEPDLLKTTVTLKTSDGRLVRLTLPADAVASKAKPKGKKKPTQKKKGKKK